MAWSMERKISTGTTVWSIGSVDYVCDVKDGTLTVESDTEEGKGICSAWSYPILTGMKWKVDCTIFVNTTLASLMGVAVGQAAKLGGIGSGTTVAISITIPDGNHAGYGIITSLGHKTSAGAIQEYSVSISGQGALS